MVVVNTDKLLVQMRRGSIEYCVLALLETEDRYGFDITRELASAGGLVTSEGTVYPLLTRLRNDGFVDTYWKDSTEGPKRRYYRITKVGRQALESFIAQWKPFRDSVDAILARRG
ncbi:MAG TPA: PadR family transcriptional regulator [Acidimicrobiales bacterium]